MKKYERAMVIELQRRGHAVQVQREFPVFYRNQPIGHLTPDLMVDGRSLLIRKLSPDSTRRMLLKWSDILQSAALN
jgi:GxxExxY protein